MTTEMKAVIEKAVRGEKLNAEEHKLLTDEVLEELGFRKQPAHRGLICVEGPDGLHCLPL